MNNQVESPNRWWPVWLVMSLLITGCVWSYTLKLGPTLATLGVALLLGWSVVPRVRHFGDILWRVAGVGIAMGVAAPWLAARLHP